MRWAVLLAFAACGGSPGTLQNVRPNASFVTDKTELYVSAPDGIRRISLDGTRTALVFGKLPHPDVPKVSVVDVSLDHKTWLLSDSHTNLWIGDPATGKVVELAALRGRLSSAALSPDGKTIAATRHSDYGAPGKQDNDDGIYLIDVATRKVEVITAQTKHWPTKIQWAKDGSAVWLTMAWEQGYQWVTLDNRKRSQLPYGHPPPLPRPLRDDWKVSPACRQRLVTGNDPELRLVDDPEKPARVLVRLEGRERGFHDYLADFSHASMTPSCQYVVFTYAGKVWVSDLTGAVAAIAEGDWLFFATVPPGGP